MAYSFTCFFDCIATFSNGPVFSIFILIYKYQCFVVLDARKPLKKLGIVHYFPSHLRLQQFKDIRFISFSSIFKDLEISSLSNSWLILNAFYAF